jgi:anti-anti-sigma factor
MIFLRGLPAAMRLSAGCWQSAATSEGRAVSPSATGTTGGAGDRTVILAVRGELDLATAPSLYQRGRGAIGRHPRLLLLDLAGVSFCDACGLTALIRIANQADAVGCRYGLIAPQPPLAKLLQITGLCQRLPVFATIEQGRRHLIGPSRPAPNP